MAKHLEVSYQQLQKYETGANRLSCSALYVIANYLKVSPLAFFSGLALRDKTQGLSSKHTAKLCWRDMEILQLIQNLDPNTTATILWVLRAIQ
jgi:transcriptional regulator with XRE-family HTH domain